MTVRVLVVDDAVVIRKILTDIINADPDCEVVGTAANGKIALNKLDQLQPDIVTLDVEMPEMDGLDTLREIRRRDRRLPVVMFSTLTSRGAVTTLDALAAGASDYVAKPANVGSTTEAIDKVTHDLVPRLKALTGWSSPVQQPVASRESERPPASTRPGASGAVDAVVIGTSTGGPVALETVLGAITEPLPVPVFVVQHMPAMFTAMLAERLDRKCASTVVEAADAMAASPGGVYIAPGGHHMVVSGSPAAATIRIDDREPVHSCRPAVDVLFESTAEVYGGRQLAVVMTGMGQDGLRGCRSLAELGAEIFTQDEATSVVWGMPGYVTEAGLASRVLPLDAIAGAITDRVRRARAFRAAAGGVVLR